MSSDRHPQMSEAGPGTSPVPRITVIIPCYNAAPFIREAIESVLRQTLRPVEIIVIDDGSTDDSAAVVRSFGDSVRLLQQPNCGESVARNRGMDEAQGDWIAFLDADDVWMPEKLQRQSRLASDDVACIHTAYRQTGNRHAVVDHSNVPPARRYQRAFIGLGNPFGPSTIMVPRTVVSRFPEWTRFGEDMVFMLELLSEGEYRYLPEALVDIRFHDRNQSGSELIDLEYYRTIHQWMSECEPSVAPQDRRAITRGWERRLAGVAARARKTGRLDTFRTIRDSVPWTRSFALLVTQHLMRQKMSSLLRRLTRLGPRAAMSRRRS